MKLLVYGHSSHTGFGTVTKELAERFLAAGIDVRVIAVNHRGEPLDGPLAGRMWPANMFGHSHGGNWSAAAIDGSFWTRFGGAWTPDVVLAVADMSGLLSHIGEPQLPAAWTSVPVFHYCPIEGDNLPVGWRGIWERIRPVAMSRYGANVIAAHMRGALPPMIYHGVDTATFHPVSASAPLEWGGRVLRSKEDCKAALGFDPMRKLILRSDRNAQRKFWHSHFAELPPVLEAHPDVDFVVHANAVEQLDAQPLLEEVGRLPARYIPRVKLTGVHDTFRGLPVEGLVVLINAADVYWSQASEGFGLNLAEAAACGVPVVANDWAAEAEVVGPGGVCLPPLKDAYGRPVTLHSVYGMDWAVPDTRAAVPHLIELLSRPSKRRALGDAGRRHVEASFSWDRAAAEFISLFEDAHAARDGS